MTDQTTPEPTSADYLAQLFDTVQELANHLHGSPVIVDNVVVVWEQVRYTPDGEGGRRIEHVMPGDRFTLSGSIGLLDVAADRLRRIVNATDDD